MGKVLLLGTAFLTSTYSRNGKYRVGWNQVRRRSTSTLRYIYTVSGTNLEVRGTMRNVRHNDGWHTKRNEELLR